jgi:hypothetical protein
VCRPAEPRPRPPPPAPRSALHGAAQALYTLADGDAAASAAAAAGDALTAAAAAAPKDNGGMFGFLADGFEAFLEVLDGALEAAHVPYSYGYAIILLTCMVKLATFPLSQKSVRLMGCPGGPGEGGRVAGLFVGPAAAGACNEWQLLREDGPASGGGRQTPRGWEQRPRRAPLTPGPRRPPPSRAQMQSTMAMQALQPRVKELQLRYANEPETLQVGGGRAGSGQCGARRGGVPTSAAAAPCALPTPWAGV